MEYFPVSLPYLFWDEGYVCGVMSVCSSCNYVGIVDGFLETLWIYHATKDRSRVLFCFNFLLSSHVAVVWSSELRTVWAALNGKSWN